jgi:hypothetical protein
LASRELEGSSRLQQGKFKRNEQRKMKTLIRSINRSPLRCGFFTVAIALCWFALSPPLKAVDCPSECGAAGNAAVGFNALDSVTTGINNAAVGTGALTADTTGSFNVAVGNGALESNTTGFQNMAIGAEALANNIIGNFNMGIGFRALFMNTGFRNSAVGAAALRNNLGASDNTAIGSTAMRENTTGEFYTAIGSGALLNNLTGSVNNAVGFNALGANVGAVFGDMNNAFGTNALASNVEGRQNSAFGDDALQFSTGDRNTAVGNEAGTAVTTGSFNVYLGDNAGSNFNHSDESNTIRIGSDTGFDGIDPTRCFIAGIAGNMGANFTSFVVLDPLTGQIGELPSSARFKKDIDPMDKTSEAIFSLKPVTFHYKNDKTNMPQFGLIAEEVAKVSPALIGVDKEGKPHTVRYEQVWIMLLNEFLKEHKKVEELQVTLAQQQKGMEVLTAQLKAQAAQIQKVSAQLEVNKPAPQVVANKP